MERRLTAILAADVVGYSKLMGEDEARTLAALAELRRELFEPVVAARGGKIIKRMGDGWIVEYPNISDATACAIEIQEKLLNHEIIRVRIGVHIGDVTFQDEDVYGDGINIAARLEAMAEPGQVLISDTAHHSLDAKAATLFEGGEEHQLKNIARPVAIWHWPLSFSNGSDEHAPKKQLPLPDKPSIAVLPFDNMSRDAEFDYFGDGLAEDILTTLSKVDNLFVIARNSSFSYKGKSRDIRDIARELGVRYVLEGSVRAAGTRLRITAQLIDAIGGDHVWAERYDRVVDDIFDIQDEITREIVTALRVNISDGEQARIWLRGTDNAQAWSLTMQGVELMWRGNPNDNMAARKVFKNALKTDPNYAAACAYIATTYLLDYHFGYTNDRSEALKNAQRFTDQALKLDPNSGAGQANFAAIAMEEGRLEDAIRLGRLAVATARNDAWLKGTFGRILTNCGHLEEGESQLREAIRLNPFGPVFYQGILANNLEMQGREQEAVKILEQALARDADYFSGQIRLASLYGLQDHIAEAKECLEQARRINPNLTIDGIKGYYPKNNAKALSRFLDGLEKAGFEQ